jgi:glutamate/tyrosine decarboxylase-like PLP-dependent enzyme
MDIPLNAMFLGPKAENAEIWQKMFSAIFLDYVHWRKNCYPSDMNVIDSKDIAENDAWFKELEDNVNEMLREFKTHLPFHSPRYIGHMLSETTLPAVMGKFVGLLFNPNNVTHEAANKSVKLENEFSESICKMLGYNPMNSLAHVCSGGSVANLEALWGVRCIQFIPLAVKDFCVKNNFSLKIQMPNRKERYIVDVDDRTLLHLQTGLKVHLIDKIIEHLACLKLGIPSLGKMSKGTNGEKQSESISKAKDEWDRYYNSSRYNIRNVGYAQVCNETGMKPVVFLPATAHYSLKKAMDILGCGTSALRYVNIDKRFRMDMTSLEQQINQLREDEFIAAVIAVAGTTEEGAVDPIHNIKHLRDEIERSMNLSFWLHIDAAWGGYIRSLFIDDHDTKQKATDILDIMDYCHSQINAVEMYIDNYRVGKHGETDDLGKATSSGKPIRLCWQDNDVIKAFLAFGDADSITIDPHKLGYVPYPAGVIAFKYKEVTKHFSSEASYVFATSSEMDAGRFSIEGSRPGSSVISCWFTAKVIPLTRHGHGKIIKTTLLNAARFKYYLTRHKRHTFSSVDKELKGNGCLRQICDTNFRVELLYDNIDTNVVSYFVYPEMHGNLRVSLKQLNGVNKKIHQNMSMPDNGSMPHFHVSSYTLNENENDNSGYPYEALEELLCRLHIGKHEYLREGLFVLRSVVMNPWYYDAMASNDDYFMRFIKDLHLNAANAIFDIMFEWVKNIIMPQVFVYLKDEKGALENVLNLLGQHGIRIFAMSVTDRENDGILRLITDDPQRTEEILTDNEDVALTTNVIVLKVNNIIKLENVLKMINEKEINISYFYSSNETSCSVLIVKVEDDDIEEALHVIMRAKKEKLILNDIEDIENELHRIKSKITKQH